MAKSTTEIERDIRRALDGVPFEVRGLWHEMRHLIETESDRPGHLRLNGRPLTGEKLAFRAGSSPIVVARLLPDLEELGLIQFNDGCYISRQLAAIKEQREKRCILTRKWRKSGGESRSIRRKNRGKIDSSDRVSHDTHRDSAVTAAQSSPSPPPPLMVSPPYKPSLPSSPLPPLSDPSDRAGVAAAGPNPKIPKRGRGKSAERVLSDQQLATRNALQDWWINHGWPESHLGAIYEFDGSDAAAILRILRSREIGWNLDRAKALLGVYLRQPELYGCVGHPLRAVGHRLNHYLSELKRAEKGISSHARTKPSESQRGHFAEQVRKLPEFGRSNVG